jgi:hypothetical protein
MSEKTEKKLRRVVRKQQLEMVRSFLHEVQEYGFFKRLGFCLDLLFKRITE